MTSCEKEQVLKVSGNAMTIDYTVQVVGKESERESVEQAIAKTFLQIDTLYNKWNPESLLSKFNDGKEGDFAELLPFLSQVDTYVALTGGRFDPTVESLKRGTEGAGWHHLQLGQNLTKNHPLTALDLGGVAKGFAVDLIVEALQAKGFKNGLVEWGGELKGWGRHPEKRPWTVFISLLSDCDPQKAIDTVTLEDEAIATSGDYHQNWRVGEDLFTHIYSIKGGGPLKVEPGSVAMVSIKAKSCALADAIATAAMLEKGDDAVRFLEELSQVEELDYWIIFR